MVPPFAHPAAILLSQVLRRHPGLQIRVAEPPDRIFILQQNSQAVTHLIPMLGRKSDTITDGIPVHLLETFVERPRPLMIPRQLAAFRILEETEDADIGPLHVIGLLVEQDHLPLHIGPERPHAEADRTVVRPRVQIQLIEERIVRAPQPGTRQVDRKVHFGNGSLHDGLGPDCTLSNLLPRSRLPHGIGKFKGSRIVGLEFSHDAQLFVDNVGHTLNVDNIRFVREG